MKKNVSVITVFFKLTVLCCVLAALFSCQNPSGPSEPTNPGDPAYPGDPAAEPTKPVFNFSSGVYWGSIELSISATNAVTIYYTRDGSDPRTPFYPLTLGTTPITVSSNATIKAVAVNADGVMSDVMSADYEFDTSANRPTINLNSGAYNTSKTITIVPDSNTVVRYTYTTDETEPANPTANDPICPASLDLAAEPLSEIYYKYKFKAFTTAHDPTLPRSATESTVVSRTWKIDTLPPPAPLGLKAETRWENKVYLDWIMHDRDTSDVRSYSVFYGQGSSPAEATTQWGTPSAGSGEFLDGLTIDTRYSFVVNAIDEAGNVNEEGSFVSWVPLEDYRTWGTLTSVSLNTNSSSGGDSASFIKMGEYLIVSLTGRGEGLDLYTLSDPSNIHRIKRLFTRGYNETAKKGHAFYGLRNFNAPSLIDVIDMSNPASPVITCSLPAEQYSEFAVSDDDVYLLVVMPTLKEIRIYDLSNPVSPTLSATYDVQESLDRDVKAISLKDGYLALDASFAGAHFYRFDSPEAITLVGSIDYMDNSGDIFLGHKDKYAIFGRTSSTEMIVRDITNINEIVYSLDGQVVSDSPRMMGDYFYAEGPRSNYSEPGDLYRWDLSSLPTIGTATVDTGAIPGNMGLRNWSKMDDSQYFITRLYSGVGCSFDISTPTAPVFGPPVTFTYESAYSYVEDGDVLFFGVDEHHNLSVIRQSLADPYSSEVTYFKKLAGEFVSYAHSAPHGNVVKVGNVYWFANGQNLIGLTESGGEFSFSVSGGYLSLGKSVYNVEATGNLIIVQGQNEIFIVDISSSSAPSLQSTIPCPFGGYNTIQHCSFVALDGKLYVSNNAKMFVYDITSPASPSIIGTLEYGDVGFPGSLTHKYCKDMVFQDGLLYAIISESTMNRKLVVVDVNTPTEPVLLGSTSPISFYNTIFGEFDRIRLNGNYCFVYNSKMVFTVIDVQDPTRPNAFSTRNYTIDSPYEHTSLYASEDKFIGIHKDMDIQYVTE